MRLLIFILVSIFVATTGCTDNIKIKNKTILYYLIISNRSNNQDTISYRDIEQPDSLDRLITKDFFTINKKDYTIKAFTSDSHAPMDGGRFYLTLESLGIIYSRSTTWFNCATLQSNNDSINKIINQALAYSLLKQQLHCYQCYEQPDTGKIKFIPPVVIDE